MLVYNIERRVYMYFHPTPVSFFFNSIFCLFVLWHMDKSNVFMCGPNLPIVNLPSLTPKLC